MQLPGSPLTLPFGRFAEHALSGLAYFIRNCCGAPHSRLAHGSLGQQLLFFLHICSLCLFDRLQIVTLVQLTFSETDHGECE
jgi:hypothetical protein